MRGRKIPKEFRIKFMITSKHSLTCVYSSISWISQIEIQHSRSCGFLGQRCNNFSYISENLQRLQVGVLLQSSSSVQRYWYAIVKSETHTYLRIANRISQRFFGFFTKIGKVSTSKYKPLRLFLKISVEFQLLVRYYQQPHFH